MLGERIRYLRESQDLTQKNLADQVGTTARNIGFYETEARKPPIHTLNKLADFFDVSIDYLLGRTDIPNIYKDKEMIENQKKEMNEYFTLEELEEFIRSKREK
jgi:transcriptional regulator with XRE-family HTH domain